MKAVSYQDYFKIQRCYDASHLDYGALTDFYLPLIGTDGLAIYLDLLREEDSATFHEHLFAHLGLTPGEFINAMNALEATGLVRTFVEEGSGCEIFTYALFAPLSADEFNQDIMLSATLKGKLGQETYDRYLSRHVGEKPNADLEEITSSFPSVFSTSLDAKLYLNTTKGKLNEKASAKTGFDIVAFVRELDQKKRKNLFSDAELAMISQAAGMYGLGQEDIMEIVERSIVSNAFFGKRLNRDDFLKQCQAVSRFPTMQLKPEPSEGHTKKDDPEKLIRYMDNHSPREFLSHLQGGGRPADADLAIANSLVMEMGLTPACTNAVLCYVLSVKNNKLPAPYCKKIAGSVLRSGCRTARDAMDYLEKTNAMEKGRARTERKDVDAPVSHIEEEAEPVNNSPITDESLDEKIKAFYKGRK